MQTPVMVLNTNTSRETGRKAQLANIAAAKVRVSGKGKCLGFFWHSETKASRAPTPDARPSCVAPHHQPVVAFIQSGRMGARAPAARGRGLAPPGIAGQPLALSRPTMLWRAPSCRAGRERGGRPPRRRCR
jgi:hypothetical protein